MKIKEGFFLREIAGSHVVLPVGERSVDFNAIINLNDSGAFLWKTMQKDLSGEEIVNNLISEYNISYDLAKKDVEKFINNLEDADLLE